MTTRADLITGARQWIGTPFAHQGRTCGAGVDCIGLVVGVVQAAGLPVDDRRDYARTPHGGELARALADQLDRIDLADAGPGDIALIAWRREPMHVGWLTDYVHGGLGLLHALESFGAVTEHRMDAHWRSLVRGVFRVRGLEE